MAISLVFSVMVYHFATNALNLSLDHQTQRIFRNFPVFSNSPMLRYGQDLAIGAHQVLFRLIYFNVFVLLFAGFASYFLARRSLRPIEVAHERQKRFTADVSHELRTPLTSLRMTSEVALLDKNASAKDLREAVESNLDDAGKMERLINNLLRLTRLDNGQVQHNFVALQSQSLVEQSLEQVAASAKAKQVKIEVTGKDGAVYGDPDSLQQLLVILLDNAIKYSPKGSIVKVVTSTNNGVSSIAVSDNGQGIALEALPHVFDRFYRADSARTNSDAEGYGLGLSIAKLIADMHHAKITLTSRPGHGTVASVAIPATAPDLKSNK